MRTRFGPWPVLAVLLSLATLAVPAFAGPADICEGAIARGAAREGVPQEVLHAISLTETGRNDGGRFRPYPWAINREGKGYWFGSREEALAFAKQSLMEGRPSFDVGCFQINYHWHGRNFPSLEAMFDPDAGAAYASQFLKSLYAERGDWSLAAGAYHSQTPERAGVYRARFDRIMAGLAGRPLAVVATAEPERVDAAPAAPKKSRTRMSKGPKIITVPKRVPAPSQEARAGEAGLGARTMQAALVF
ncbi:MAG TPA: lytic transglycosylase domain-containing protein [Amaricoccus sp.]|nr:lytic transglycosylase domain-containing protein [Amaricoccus sp.]